MNNNAITIIITVVFSDNSCLTVYYIANRSMWKRFAVVKINCSSLENIWGWRVVLYGHANLFHRLRISLESLAVTKIDP